MAEKWFIASIVCFVLSGVFFIVTVSLFFSLQIQDTIRRLTGQSQLQWIMKEGSKKSDKSKAITAKISQKYPADNVETDTPTAIADELPTMLDDGKEKQDSLFSVYEADIATEMENPQSERKLAQGEIPTALDSEIPTGTESLEGKNRKSPTDLDTYPEFICANRVNEMDSYMEETELETDFEESTEVPSGCKDFVILKTILYIHTDEVI